jgi:DNA-binding CsgD family transcriptional regulator
MGGAEVECTWTKTKPTVLSRGERDILLMAAAHPGGKHLSLSEIGQRRSISVNSVRMALHRVCVKLEARNRYEAILFAVRRGEINPGEYLSPDEITETVSSLGPTLLRRLAHQMRQELVEGHLLKDAATAISSDRPPGTILTKRERDVLILVAHGLPNVEIAARLYISLAAVRMHLTRASNKLGACNRGDAVVLSMNQGEISLGEMFSLEELAEMWAPMGSELIENTARMLNVKFDERTAIGN